MEQGSSFHAPTTSGSSSGQDQYGEGGARREMGINTAESFSKNDQLRAATPVIRIFFREEEKGQHVDTKGPPKGQGLEGCHDSLSGRTQEAPSIPETWHFYSIKSMMTLANKHPLGFFFLPQLLKRVTCSFWFFLRALIDSARADHSRTHGQYGVRFS